MMLTSSKNCIVVVLSGRVQGCHRCMEVGRSLLSKLGEDLLDLLLHVLRQFRLLSTHHRHQASNLGIRCTAGLCWRHIHFRHRRSWHGWHWWCKSPTHVGCGHWHGRRHLRHVLRWWWWQRSHVPRHLLHWERHGLLRVHGRHLKHWAHVALWRHGRHHHLRCLMHHRRWFLFRRLVALGTLWSLSLPRRRCTPSGGGRDPMSLPILLLLPWWIVILTLVRLRCLLRAMHIRRVYHILPWLLAIGAIQSRMLPQLFASSAFPRRSIWCRHCWCNLA